MTGEIMEKENKQTEAQPSVEEKEVKESTISFMGRDYDVTNESGRAALAAAHYMFEKMHGKQAQELGETRKAAKRQYNLTRKEDDSDAILAKVEKLREDGEYGQADRLMLQYSKELAKANAVDTEFEMLWKDYRFERADIFREIDELDQEAYKDVIKRNYMNELASAEDPFDFIDAKLEKRISRIKESKAAKPAQDTSSFEDDVPSLLDSGVRSKKPNLNAKSKEEEKSVEEVVSKHLGDMGFSDSF